jgi:hypothetical protein
VNPEPIPHLIFKKNTHSGLPELPCGTEPDFRKSTRSPQGNEPGCIEPAVNVPGRVFVRDSTLVDACGNNTSPVLEFQPDDWAAFLRDVAPPV